MVLYDGKEDAISYYAAFGLEFFNKTYMIQKTKTAVQRH